MGRRPPLPDSFLKLWNRRPLPLHIVQAVYVRQQLVPFGVSLPEMTNRLPRLSLCEVTSFDEFRNCTVGQNLGMPRHGTVPFGRGGYRHSAGRRRRCWLTVPHTGIKTKEWTGVVAAK